MGAAVLREKEPEQRHENADTAAVNITEQAAAETVDSVSAATRWGAVQAKTAVKKNQRGRKWEHQPEQAEPATCAQEQMRQALVTERREQTVHGEARAGGTLYSKGCDASSTDRSIHHYAETCPKLGHVSAWAPAVHPEGAGSHAESQPRSSADFTRRQRPVRGRYAIRTKQRTGKISYKTVQKKTPVRPQNTAQEQMKRYGRDKLVQQAKRGVGAAARTSRKAVSAVTRTTVKLVSTLAGAIGGGTLLVLLCAVVLIAAVAASPFGIFFSGTQDTADAISPQAAVAQINAEYAARLEELESGDYDSVERTGAPPDWREVFAVFACKTAGTDDGMEVTVLDAERVELLREVFWDMTDISTDVEAIEHPDEKPEDSMDEGRTERILHISITAKSAAEMESVYGFTPDQQTQLTELLSEENNELWTALLSGLASGSSDIVAVALSQVGNVGGRPFWSWYGFSSRVAWCACFVSWCGEQCGYMDAGILPKFSYCDTGVEWFKARGQWQSRDYVPAPGDIIFFDPDGNGCANHVGIVEACDSSTVYTVEGNANDAVKQLSYPVGDYRIMGYGLPAY